MIDDVVLNKKESIERCIRQIRRYYAQPSDLPFVEDFLKQDAIALNLQRAAEQCIDLANHVVRVKRLGIPKQSREGFGMLRAAGIISDPLARNLEAMVGFRNVLVHDYQNLDLNVIQDVLEYKLDDFIEFTVRVMES
ncbi:type VII toxin-antitoxin system HepT family RNase toxin [Desulfonatronum thioautotrophicum]|uniref:type VII toxin-antitoxin system HepT family RNase toxin n=1 Tax=Desulfonatronum thioautotrophicum TaxID=617001 RepID=UPI0005EB086A|nr:DUF86 domain-containing protein [Desulfonatronum thioautotrophicum]